jgi:hypothetical protein
MNLKNEKLLIHETGESVMLIPAIFFYFSVFWF